MGSGLVQRVSHLAADISRPQETTKTPKPFVLRFSKHKGSSPYTVLRAPGIPSDETRTGPYRRYAPESPRYYIRWLGCAPDKLGVPRGGGVRCYCWSGIGRLRDRRVGTRGTLFRWTSLSATSMMASRWRKEPLSSWISRPTHDATDMDTMTQRTTTRMTQVIMTTRTTSWPPSCWPAVLSEGPISDGYPLSRGRGTEPVRGDPDACRSAASDSALAPRLRPSVSWSRIQALSPAGRSPQRPRLCLEVYRLTPGRRRLRSAVDQAGWPPCSPG